MASTGSSPSSPEEPITAAKMLAVLRQERPELLEEWEQEGAMLAAELERLAANAQWLWEQRQAPSSALSSVLAEPRHRRALSIAQAVALATRDDLYNENTFDRHPDAEPLSETQLRSGWFST